MEPNEDGSYTIKGKIWRLPPNYKLHSVLGSGAYGCVCRCTNLDNSEEVAVKRIEDVFVSKTDALRILREISILRRLKHKNIVRLFNVLNPTDPPAPLKSLYVFFEYAGMDLHKFAHSDRTLEIDQVQKIMVQLCEGLRFMHRSCVIHRDIKPANILIDPETYTIKIADFGLSRVLDEATAGTVRSDMEEDTTDSDSDGTSHKDTHSSAAPSFVPPKMQRAMSEHVVTRWYRAPEVILCRGHYAQSIDVWSVGCIFAELLNLLSNVDKSQRRPLFPGRSCFPLSPSSNTCFKDMTDQLNVIFGIVGTPTHEEVMELDAGPDVRSYLTQLNPAEAINLRDRYPHAPEEAVTLLKGLLEFSGSKRTRLEVALADPFLREAVERERAAEREAGEAGKAKAVRLTPGQTDSVTKADLDRLGGGGEGNVEALRGGGREEGGLVGLDDDGGEGGGGEGEDGEGSLEAPAVLIRSHSMLTAKKLLRLQFESKYDRRNHTEAVQKLSALFRDEIDALHETAPMQGGGS